MGRRWWLETSISRIVIMPYFKRHWDGTRGDSYNDWGSSIWYFETDLDMCVTRQIEVYANGNVLHYDRKHIEDKYGGLSEKPIDADDFAPFVILQSEFEQAWASRRPFNK